MQSLRGTGDQTSLHPCLLDICAALLYYEHGPETPWVRIIFSASINSITSQLQGSTPKFACCLLPTLSHGNHTLTAIIPSEAGLQKKKGPIFRIGHFSSMYRRAQVRKLIKNMTASRGSSGLSAAADDVGNVSEAKNTHHKDA